MKINIDEILKKFGRITSSGDFVPEIDGLRFFAVISVLLYHINEYILSHCSQAVKLQAEKSFLNVLLSQGHYGVSALFCDKRFYSFPTICPAVWRPTPTGLSSE